MGILKGLVHIYIYTLYILLNISQNENRPQIGVKIKNFWNHHLVYCITYHSALAAQALLTGNRALFDS